MTRIFLLAFALLLTTTPATRADIACDPGGLVATSSSGAATVNVSPHGCRQFPDATYTVQIGGADRHTIRGIRGGSIHVSDTGRTVLAVESDSVRADQKSFIVYRDGRRFGVYPIAELLGASSTAVTDGRYVRVTIDGVYLVIDDLDGTGLYREHLGTLRANRRPDR